jgi:hypothetical protein
MHSNKPLRPRRTGSIFALLALAACTPTIKIAVPNEPITINLNVRIEHEIRVKVEEELNGIFTVDSGLF